MRESSKRLDMTLPVLLGAAAIAPAAGAADLDHREVVDIARASYPEGIVVEVEDEIYDGVESTYEVEFLIDGGATLVDIEVNRVSGLITQYTEIPQSNNQQQTWEEIIDLLPQADIDYRQAYNKALRRFPNAAITEIDLRMDATELEFNVHMRDNYGAFDLEYDADDGKLDFDLDRGVQFDEIIEVARAEQPNGTVAFARLKKKSSGQWIYIVKMLKNNGNKQVTMKFDAMTGEKLSSNVIATSGTLQAKYQAINQLIDGAQLDFYDAIRGSREEIGGGRPIITQLVVTEGALEYKTKMKLGSSGIRVWVDAISGEVTDRQ